LSLISNLIDNIGKKKVFTKMNLRWRYNNVKVKEEDEWKAAFSILEDAYKLTVMFFGLANSLAIFQAIINDFLRDLIETGDIVACIDDVMIEMEMEEEQDKIVEEILKKNGRE